MKTCNIWQRRYNVLCPLTIIVAYALVVVCAFGCWQEPTANRSENAKTEPSSPTFSSEEAEKTSQEQRRLRLKFGGDLGSGNSGVRYAPFTDDDLEKIKATQVPFTLAIYHSEIGDSDLERIVGNPRITKISLVDVPNLTDAAVEKLARCPNAKSIWLVKIPQLKNPNFAAFADCKSLKSLYLTSCSNLSPESLAGLANCKGLKLLQLCSCPVSDATLAQLAKSPSLTSLLLVGCSGLTDAGLAQLSGAANLKTLMLEANPKLTEEGVDALRKKLPQTKIIFAP